MNDHMDTLIRSVLSDIGDAAGVPREVEALQLGGTGNTGVRRRAAPILATAAVLVCSAVGLIAFRIRTDSVTSTPTTSASTSTTPDGRWLDLATTPNGFKIVPNTPETRTGCLDPGNTRPTCESAAYTEIAYTDDRNDTVEIRTIFTNVEPNDYLDELLQQYPGEFTRQAVTVRGRSGTLIVGGSTLLVWRERSGVIEQVRLVDKTSDLDITALAETLVERDPVLSDGD